MPLGAPPTGTTPAIVATAPGAFGARSPVPSEPVVESYDEETYRIKPTDTWETICKEKYGSAVYIVALQMFNREHFGSSDAMRGNPPALQPGQSLFIPELKVLEHRYASQVPGLTPLPTPPVQPPGVPTTARSSPSGVPGPEYKVQAPNETFWDIARRTLGRPERWGDIWRLNPNYANPNAPLPVGAVIRLPAS